MFDLDLRSRLPIYEQLVEKYKQLIINNLLPANEQLPSVRQLAHQLTINPNTIQKAYRTLEQQGYIYSLPGKGSFVAPINNTLNHQKIQELMQQIEPLICEAAYHGISEETLHDFIQSIYKKNKENNGCCK